MRKRSGVIVISIVIPLIIVTIAYYEVQRVREFIDANISLVTFLSFLIGIPSFLYLLYLLYVFLSEKKKIEKEPEKESQESYEEKMEKIRNFRKDRLEKIRRGETPVPSNNKPKIVLHVVPFMMFSSRKINLISSPPENLRPITEKSSTTYIQQHHTLDGGFVSYEVTSGDLGCQYAMMLVNGVIEAVNMYFLDAVKDKSIIQIFIEKVLFDAVNEYLSVEKKVGAKPPFIIMLSYLGVRNYKIRYPWMGMIPCLSCEINENDLLIPEIEINSFECSHADMKLVFDRIWNAVGLPHSLNYDDEGKWVGN